MVNSEEISPDGKDRDESDLINAEFESMVAGLSLDESAPTTYLDELDRREDENHFIAPIPPKKPIRLQIRQAINGFLSWKDRRSHDDDGIHL